jgi:hypothetical protein
MRKFIMYTPYQMIFSIIIMFPFFLNILYQLLKLIFIGWSIQGGWNGWAYIQNIGWNTESEETTLEK